MGKPKQDAESDYGRHETAGKLHPSCAYQITYALGIVHDPGDELAGLRRIEIADWPSRNLRLDFLAHLRNRALGCHAQDLRQAERRSCLYKRCAARCQCNFPKQIGAAFHDRIAWLTIISTAPRISRCRCAQTSSRASAQAFVQRIFFCDSAIGFYLPWRSEASLTRCARKTQDECRSRVSRYVLIRSGEVSVVMNPM